MAERSGQPSVAICIGTYNQAQYLESSIESALAQTYPIKEIWVSDDCSTDNTPEVMGEICRRHPWIQYLRQPKNLGLPGNLSSVLSRPKTDLIVRLDSDDRLEAEYVSVLATLMEVFPQAGFAHCNVYELGQHDARMRTRVLTRRNVFESPEEALRRNASGFRVAANCILYRAQALRDANYYYPNIGWRYSEDWDLCLRIAAKGWGNVFSELFLSNYRVWEDAQHVRATRKMSEVTTTIEVYKGTLEPEYKLRGWNTDILYQNMRKKAVGFTDAIDSPLFSQAEREEYKQRLRELGDCWKLSSAIYLVEHGFNPAMKSISNLKLRVRDAVKNLLRVAAPTTRTYTGVKES